MTLKLNAESLDGKYRAEFRCSRKTSRIGRNEDCDIILDRKTVSRYHAEIRRNETAFIIKDLNSSTGLIINGKKATEQALHHNDRILIGDVEFFCELIKKNSKPNRGSTRGATSRMSPAIAPDSTASGAPSADSPEKDSIYGGTRKMDSPFSEQPPGGGTRRITTTKFPDSRYYSHPEEAPENQKLIIQPFIQKSHQTSAEDLDPYTKIRASIHQDLVNRMNLRRFRPEQMGDQELWVKARRVANEIIFDLDNTGKLPHWCSPNKLLKDVLNDTLGLGPIQDFLEDEDIEEIMVNGPFHIYIYSKSSGSIIDTNRKFIDEERVMTVINRIVAPLGRTINKARPMVDARLSDGSRVNAIIPPLSLAGPVVTIRKFPQNPLKPEDLIAKKTLNQAILDFLKLAVAHRQNILICGGTGAGKTTLLNIVSSFIHRSERIVTIEDSAELQLQQPHWVPLETRPSSLEGTCEVTIRDLVRNSLRMRPDRIIVGECRGPEAVDMLQAMNTGHDGSLTTGHSNSARDILSRLETMVLTAGMDLPLRAIREQISRAIDLIVYIERFPDGIRRITEVCELVGLENEVYILGDIYKFEYEVTKDQEITGRFVPKGYIPRFVQYLRERGVEIPLSIFRL